MRIAFYAGGCLPIHARTLNERPLGGTETALIRLAELLQIRGHDVTVFTTHSAPPPSAPLYLPTDYVFKTGQFDLFVCVKDWRPAVSNAPGKRFFYWTGDGYDQYINYGLGDRRVVEKVEWFLAVSEWHKRTLCSESGFPEAQTAVISNGVNLPDFEGTEKRRRKKLIYTSAPYRGLTFVPKIFSEVLRRHSDAELHVFAGLSVYDTDEPFRGPYVADYDRIKRELSKLPNCEVHGNVVQYRLARELMSSSIWVYPNAIFETCCITALEAQAAGCAIVASANSALPETVGGAGETIEGHPGEASYQARFVDAVDRLLSDDALWEQYSGAGMRQVREEHTWERVADRFEALL